jgi:hypothetical protein
MSSVPQARDELNELADQLEGNGLQAEADRLRQIIEHRLRREPVIRRAPRKSVPFTPELAKAVRKFAQLKPQRTQMEIAQTFGINPGRVSEALAGRW